jgi:hypothetical protein
VREKIGLDAWQAKRKGNGKSHSNDNHGDEMAAMIARVTAPMTQAQAAPATPVPLFPGEEEVQEKPMVTNTAATPHTILDHGRQQTLRRDLRPPKAAQDSSTGGFLIVEI